ncbi:MAG: DNA repair protein RecO [Clostridia bacterium]|nr:DNA repair protein RecO [Clostridia bacterium]
MMIQTSGIVIRESPVNEHDKVITLLTRDYGVIRAFANGARLPKHKIAAASCLLTFSNFSLNKNEKSVFTVREATVNEVFFDLRKSVPDLALAQYFAELSLTLAPREEVAKDFLRLLLNALALLCKNQKPHLLLKPTVELRMLSLAGYMPSLVACDGCGAYLTEEMRFCPGSGRLFCSACTPNARFVPVHGSVVTAMRHICFSPPEKVFAFRLTSERAMKELAEASERYVLQIVPERLMTLDFYKVLMT